MSVYTISSRADLENLKQLAKNQSDLSNQRIHDKILKQTFDIDLAEQYAPITDTIKDVGKATVKAIEDVPDAVNTAVEIANFKQMIESSQPGMNVSKDVFVGLAPMITSKNTMKLKFVNDTIRFNGRQVSFDKNYIVVDDKKFELTPKVMEALTNTSVKLNKFPERDLNIFLELLKAINYDPSLDRKSKRRDFLIEHYTPQHDLSHDLSHDWDTASEADLTSEEVSASEK